MTQEEKAKLYDEAVINGSRLWECDKITREDYEFIFPALEEGEDERIIGNIIATIHLYYGEPLEDEAKEMIAWLEKQGDQKPADTEKGAKGNERKIPNSVWSEEDDKLLELSVDNLTELKNRFGKEYGRTGDCIDWLKSLKERYTWKPSEEQIDALVSAIDVMIDNRGAGDKKTILLSGLYHELKAL